MQSSTIRSARSISPPLASSPSDSALARSYDTSDDAAMMAKGSSAMCGLSVDARYHATPPSSSGVGDPVDHGVEERAPLAGGVRCLGQRAVEQIGQRGQDDEQQPEPQGAAADGDRGGDAEHEAEDREVVGAQPGAAQTVAERLDGPLDRCAETYRRTRRPGYRPPLRARGGSGTIAGTSDPAALHVAGAHVRWGSSTVKTYPTAKIRNVALVGHSGSGKTTLVEALLARSGAIAAARQRGGRHDRLGHRAGGESSGGSPCRWRSRPIEWDG